MSDPNLITVFDKNGEPFETTRANARDLVTHVGWSYSRPTVIEKVVEAKPEPAPVVEVETAAAPVVEPETTVSDEKTEDPFAGMDRDAVAAYITANFPDATFHHKTGRDKLVELALSLAGE